MTTQPHAPEDGAVTGQALPRPEGRPAPRRSPGMRRIVALGLLLAVVPLTGCSAPPSAARSFRIEYATGAIPPPYNHQYVVEATFTSSGAEVTYSLTYPYREGMSDEELQTLGYSRDDAIEWQGDFGADVAGAWQDLAGQAVLVDPPAPLPGADSLFVRVQETDGSSRAGTPGDRQAWLAVAAAVDTAARAELESRRPAP